MALRRIFSRKGWEVTEALDGHGALALLLSPAAERFDVVLSDLRMPGMSGAQLYEKVAAERPEVAQRMLFSSGDVHSTEAVELARKSGVTILEKPFDLTELVQLAERIVAKP